MQQRLMSQMQGRQRFGRKAHITGMLGVYLTAAELTNSGFIVSPTSRSALGADLLVTDQRCRMAWSVQVKTQRRQRTFGW